MPIEVNMVAVIVATVAHMLIGFLWYSVIFAKPWTRLMGWTKDTPEGMAEWQKRQSNMTMTWVWTVLSAFIMAYVLAHFIILVHAQTLADAHELAFWAWLGFIATTSLTNAVFVGKNKKLWAIDTFYPLVSLLVMSSIFILWK